MKKKKYVPPVVMTESVEIDSDFALGCGTVIHSSTLSCLYDSSPNEFEDLVDGWGLDPNTAFDSAAFNGIVFSNNSCSASCYQGPYDSFFSS